jgi:hypothetical protein
MLLICGSVARAENPPPKSLVILFLNSGNALMVNRTTTVVVEALNELGFKVELRGVPLARGAQEIKKESIDGELVRIREYGDSHPELVRVEEPLATAYFSVYAKPGKKVPCDWPKLVQSDLRIDFQRGIYYFEMNLKNYMSPRIQAMDHPLQLFQRLRSNRSDLFLLDKFSAEKVMAESNEKWNMVRVCDIHVAPTFMYLKRRHTDLANKLPAVLRKMKN